MHSTIIAVVAIASSSLAMAACAAGEAEEPAEGFQRITGEWTLLDIPADWLEVESSGEWAATYQDADGDRAAYQVRLIEDSDNTAPGMTADLHALAPFDLSHFRNMPPEERPQWVRDEPEPEDYRDFHHAWFTYTGDDGMAYKSALWGVADDDRKAALVQLTAADLDDELTGTI